MIVVRRVPSYTFVVTTAVESGTAIEVVKRAFGRARGFSVRNESDSNGSEGNLTIGRSHFWSPQPAVEVRTIPSVAGSNVHVRMMVPPIWSTIILVLAALFLLAAGSSFSQHEAAAGALLVLLIAALFAAGVALLEARDFAISAFSEEPFPVAQATPAWKALDFTFPLIVVMLGFAGIVYYRSGSPDAPAVLERESLLNRVTFAPGSSRRAVIAKLGRPDVELKGDQIRQYTTYFDPDCVKNAVTQLQYWSSKESGGAYCSIYLDSEARVLCVEHGDFVVQGSERAARRR